MRTLRRTTALSLLFACAAGLTPAAHAVTGQVIVSSTTVTDSTSFKQARAACPKGQRVIGGGGEIIGGNNQVRLTTLWPWHHAATDQDFFEAGATEDDIGYSAPWSVRAYAICAEAASLPGWEIVQATTSQDVQPGKTAKARCPGGKHVLGFGGFAAERYSTPNVVLQNITLNAVNEVAVYASEDETGFRNWIYAWSVTAYAICTNPLPGTTRPFAASPTASTDTTLTVACDAGLHIAAVAGGTSNRDGQVYLTRLIPRTSPFEGAIITAQEDETGYPGTWNTTLRTTCT